MKAFSVNFEQHCEGQTTALFGWLRLHALLEQFSVTDAVVQGSSAVFTVTLSPALSTSVSVTFSTANGTAIAGIDYAATTQTVSLSPGMTQQTITVPLFKTGNSPKKVFYGQLSSPNGAAVWIRQGSAQF
ncbi:MAG TPA: Calx-beta domain-containing protein [Anaerolineae bacterium]